MRLFCSLAAASLLFIGTCATSWADASLTGSLIEVLHQKGVIDDASYGELKKTGGGEQAVNKRLIEVLHDKGVLDEAAYKKLSEQAATEATVAAAAPAPAAPAVPVSEARPSEPTVREAVKPVGQALTAVEEGIARLGGDTVKMKISMFIQAGWLNDDAGFSVQSPPTTGTSLTSGNQFFVRRARLFFDGQLWDKLGFKVSTEMSDTNGKILRDAYVYADYIPYARVTLGQMKVPFGVEGVESLANNPTINRSFATNFMHAVTIYNTVNAGTNTLFSLTTLRDQGATLSGKYQARLGGLPFGAGYAMGLFNGTGQNTTDDNNQKDFVGRVWLTPLVDGLTAGGSWYYGKTHTSLATDSNKNRRKWAADFDYNPPYITGLKLRGEFMWEKRFFGAYTSKNIITTPGPAIPGGGFYDRSFGWYLLAAYKVDGLNGYLKYLNGFEPVFRYDVLDEDLSAPDTTRDRWTLGMNYYLAKDTRLMVNYEIIHADGPLSTRSFEAIDTKSHHLFTGLFQLKF